LSLGGQGFNNLTSVGDLGARILAGVPAEAKALVEPLIPQIVLGIHQAMSLAIANSMWLGVIAAMISVGVALLIPEVALRREHNAQSAAAVRTAPIGDPAPPGA
jgi:hypothetical protein